MKLFTSGDFHAFEKYHRINFVNTLSGLRSASLIGTMGEHGLTNLAIFNTLVHIGANPPFMGFIMRPHTVERHTYENILKQKSYTINLIHPGIIEQAHQTSAKFERKVSEFEKCQFTEEYINDFPVPFVGESRVKMGLSFVEQQHIQCNRTILIIGKVEQVSLSEDVIDDDGTINHEKLQTVAVSGLNSYYDNRRSAKLPYARP